MYQKLGAAILTAAFAAPLAPFVATAANAAPVNDTPPIIRPLPKRIQPVEDIKHQVVQSLIKAASNSKSHDVISDALLKDGQADLRSVLKQKAGAADPFTKFVEKADSDIKRLKGLSKMTDSALQIRLVNPEVKEKMKPGAGRDTILFAASTSADEIGSTITAYDRHGKQFTLDVHKPPTVPVVLVELDAETVVPAAVRAINDEFAAAGVGSAMLPLIPLPDDVGQPVPPPPGPSKIVTRMDKVKVSNDKEPWTSGKAEFYGMALGQGKDGKARVDLVQMPYLDHSDTTYFPNQIIVDWSHYKWNAVDFMFMEHDDNTNYRDIAVAIATAIAPFTGSPEYVALGIKVLEALPASWYTNDDDYADSLYFLTRDSIGDKVGAANNAKVTLSKRTVTT